MLRDDVIQPICGGIFSAVHLFVPKSSTDVVIPTRQLSYSAFRVFLLINLRLFPRVFRSPFTVKELNNVLDFESLSCLIITYLCGILDSKVVLGAHGPTQRDLFLILADTKELRNQSQ